MIFVDSAFQTHRSKFSIPPHISELLGRRTTSRSEVSKPMRTTQMKIGQYTLETFGYNSLYIATPRKIEKYMNSGGILFFYLFWRFILILTHTVNAASRFGGRRATLMGIWILNRHPLTLQWIHQQRYLQCRVPKECAMATRRLTDSSEAGQGMWSHNVLLQTHCCDQCARPQSYFFRI